MSLILSKKKDWQCMRKMLIIVSECNKDGMQHNRENYILGSFIFCNNYILLLVAKCWREIWMETIDWMGRWLWVQLFLFRFTSSGRLRERICSVTYCYDSGLCENFYFHVPVALSQSRVDSCTIKEQAGSANRIVLNLVEKDDKAEFWTR
jgi:hypothetical protein